MEQNQLIPLRQIERNLVEDSSNELTIARTEEIQSIVGKRKQWFSFKHNENKNLPGPYLRR